MPFVIAGDPKLFDRGPGAALAGAGRRVTETAENLSKMRLLQQAEERRAAEADRRLDIAEMNAKARVLRESNALQEKEAAKTAAMSDFQEFAGEQVGAGHARGIREAMQEGQPILGPYGMLNPKAIAQSTARAAETAFEMKKHIELADRMAPTEARGYLTRETAKVKEKTRRRGFDDETEALAKAIKDGVFEPPEIQAAGKARPEPSETAVAAAAEMGKLLATARDQGKDPGDVTKRIGELYNAQRQLRSRMSRWEKADVKATELFGVFQQLVDSVPADSYAPGTETPLKQEMTERLMQAEAQWEGTKSSAEVSTFRLETDPQDSLAALQKVLFQAEAVADPAAAMQRSRSAQDQRMLETREGRGFPPPSREELAAAAGGTGGPMDPGAPGAADEVLARQGSQAAPGAWQAAQAPPDAVGAPPPPAKRGLGAKQRGPKTGVEDVADVRNYTLDRAKQVHKAGINRERAALELIRGLRKDLGIDPHDPEAKVAIRQALVDAYGR